MYFHQCTESLFINVLYNRGSMLVNALYSSIYIIIYFSHIVKFWISKRILVQDTFDTLSNVLSETFNILSAT